MAREGPSSRGMHASILRGLHRVRVQCVDERGWISRRRASGRRGRAAGEWGKACSAKFAEQFAVHGRPRGP